jgi:hypothetical protein
MEDVVAVMDEHAPKPERLETHRKRGTPIPDESTTGACDIVLLEETAPMAAAFSPL